MQYFEWKVKPLNLRGCSHLESSCCLSAFSWADIGRRLESSAIDPRCQCFHGWFNRNTSALRFGDFRARWQRRNFELERSFLVEFWSTSFSNQKQSSSMFLCFCRASCIRYSALANFSDFEIFASTSFDCLQSDFEYVVARPDWRPCQTWTECPFSNGCYALHRAVLMTTRTNTRAMACSRWIGAQGGRYCSCWRSLSSLAVLSWVSSAVRISRHSCMPCRTWPCSFGG